jgi:hypothetical protein
MLLVCLSVEFLYLHVYLVRSCMYLVLRFLSYCTDFLCICSRLYTLPIINLIHCLKYGVVQFDVCLIHM